MAKQFGLTAQGFVPMQQSDVVTDLESGFQTQFGNNVNFSAEAVIGGFVGIMSGRFATLWQLGEAIYSSQYPTGAEGTSVDNILALNNLKRNLAKGTQTAQQPLVETNGLTQWGLVCFGVPGTVIPAGNLITTSTLPALQFSIDASVTIGSSANAVQGVYFGNVPSQGSFSLSIQDPAGNTLTMASSPWNVLSNQSQLNFSAVPDSGTFTISLTQAGATLTTAAISYTALAADVQAAIRLLAGYSTVSVAGSYSAGFVLSWAALSQPIVTTGSNSLLSGSTAVVISPIDSIQATVNNLYDSTANNYPYTDVYVSGSFSAGVLFTFGAGTVVGSNPASSIQQQALMTINSNSLQMSTTVTNVNIVTTVTGTPAQAIASATCTQTGANFVAANVLTGIGTPVSGWTSVTNQLDCTTGSADETDTDALIRRSNSLAEQANGPIQAIAEKVQAVSNVITAKGFQNLFGAAQQKLTFGSVPVSGSFEIVVGFQTTGTIAYNASAATIQAALAALTGYSSTLVTGNIQFGFTIDWNGSNGGQGQKLIQISTNTTGVTITPAYGRPGKSFEIVALGGADADIAQVIYGSMPAGTQSYGNTSVQIVDKFNNPITIRFSRPTEVPIYVSLVLLTDYFNIPGDPGSGGNIDATFVPQSVPTIQQDIVTIGGLVSIGGTVIGFGSNGLIGAFNNVPGITQYTMYFGTSPNPVSNANIPVLSEQIPVYEVFNVVVQWS